MPYPRVIEEIFSTKCYKQAFESNTKKATNCWEQFPMLTRKTWCGYHGGRTRVRLVRGSILEVIREGAVGHRQIEDSNIRTDSESL
jgi:hypothetical protein